MSAGCPKAMVYGPCGGVSAAGACEVDERRCVFVDSPVVRWHQGHDQNQRDQNRHDENRHDAETSALDAALGMSPGRPVIIADLPAKAVDVESLRRSAGRLAGVVDAVLLGDHGSDRVQLPPALRADLVQREGVRAWAGLNCRDRNRVALEAELAGLAAVSAAGVHCITGDHTRLGHRPDALPVFDLDSTRLVALARARGLTTSVAENPVAPPLVQRPQRAAEKARAGAQICFVNHTSGPQAVADFVEQTQEACAGDGVRLEFVACVAVVSDVASAQLLRTFTGLELPRGYLERILAAADVEAAGLRAATRLAEALLAVPGVRGVNLSGVAPAGDEDRVSAVMAQIATAILR